MSVKIEQPAILHEGAKFNPSISPADIDAEVSRFAAEIDRWDKDESRLFPMEVPGNLPKDEAKSGFGGNMDLFLAGKLDDFDAGRQTGAASSKMNFRSRVQALLPSRHETEVEQKTGRFARVGERLKSLRSTPRKLGQLALSTQVKFYDTSARVAEKLHDNPERNKLIALAGAAALAGGGYLAVRYGIIGGGSGAVQQHTHNLPLGSNLHHFTPETASTSTLTDHTSVVAPHTAPILPPSVHEQLATNPDHATLVSNHSHVIPSTETAPQHVTATDPSQATHQNVGTVGQTNTSGETSVSAHPVTAPTSGTETGTDTGTSTGTETTTGAGAGGTPPVDGGAPVPVAGGHAPVSTGTETNPVAPAPSSPVESGSGGGVSDGPVLDANNPGQEAAGSGLAQNGLAPAGGISGTENIGTIG